MVSPTDTAVVPLQSAPNYNGVYMHQACHLALSRETLMMCHLQEAAKHMHLGSVKSLYALEQVKYKAYLRQGFRLHPDDLEHGSSVSLYAYTNASSAIFNLRPFSLLSCKVI